jgi:hypothetical protein
VIDGQWKITDVICSEPDAVGAETENLVQLAKADLAARLDISPDQIEVQSLEATQFPDASLEVPEPDKVYAQVDTPGYVIELAARGEVHKYHGAGNRVVLIPNERATLEGSITVMGVQVRAGERIIVQGRSTLLDGTCLATELWADGKPQTWWPENACVPIQNGAWQFTVVLGQERSPVELNSTAQYMLRVYQQNGPNNVSVFPFDLAGPPTPNP